MSIENQEIGGIKQRETLESNRSTLMGRPCEIGFVRGRESGLTGEREGGDRRFRRERERETTALNRSQRPREGFRWVGDLAFGWLGRQLMMGLDFYSVLV